MLHGAFGCLFWCTSYVVVQNAWSVVLPLEGGSGRCNPRNHVKQCTLVPRPPNVPLLRALWSLLVGIWCILKGSWGVLVFSSVYYDYGSSCYYLCCSSLPLILKPPKNVETCERVFYIRRVILLYVWKMVSKPPSVRSAAAPGSGSHA